MFKMVLNAATHSNFFWNIPLFTRLFYRNENKIVHKQKYFLDKIVF